MTRCLFTALAILPLLNASNRAVADSPIEAKRRECRDTLARALKTYEAWVARETKLQQRGASSDLLLNLIRQSLILLRHDLALADGDTDAVKAQSAELIKQRVAHYRRMQFLLSKGAIDPAWVDLARRRLATAHYLEAMDHEDEDAAIEALESVISVSQAELQRAQNAAKTGGVSASEVERIRARIEVGRHLIARQEGEPDKARDHLRNVIALLTKDVNRIRKLMQSGAATKPMLLDAENYLLWAQVEAAIEDNQRERTRELLAKLIATTKEHYTFLKGHPEIFLPEQLDLIKTNIRDYEVRLAEAADRDVELESLSRLPLGELDR